MAEWERHPPQIYSIVTGFFPESNPKETWATNPRPMLVCGVAKDDETGMHFVRVAYGTTQHIDRAHDDDLVIGNISRLNELRLKHTTRFVLHSGELMAILPWIQGVFQPWSGRRSPVLSVLPESIQKHVGYTLTQLPDLPQF